MSCHIIEKNPMCPVFRQTIQMYYRASAINLAMMTLKIENDLLSFWYRSVKSYKTWCGHVQISVHLVQSEFIVFKSLYFTILLQISEVAEGLWFAVFSDRKKHESTFYAVIYIVAITHVDRRVKFEFENNASSFTGGRIKSKFNWVIRSTIT
jgi:hypothetical protein